MKSLSPLSSRKFLATSTAASAAPLIPTQAIGDAQNHRMKVAPDNSSVTDSADFFGGYFEHLRNVL